MAGVVDTHRSQHVTILISCTPRKEALIFLQLPYNRLPARSRGHGAEITLATAKRRAGGLETTTVDHLGIGWLSLGGGVQGSGGGSRISVGMWGHGEDWVGDSPPVAPQLPPADQPFVWAATHLRRAPLSALLAIGATSFQGAGEAKQFKERLQLQRGLPGVCEPAAVATR